MESDRKSFRKMFPNLSKELCSGENTVSIDEVQTDPDETEKANSDKFRNYDPSAVDFLRRCANEKEATEIIEYLEKRHEITKDQAREFRKQLEEKGLRSFGPRKEDDYYFKQSGLV